MIWKKVADFCEGVKKIHGLEATVRLIVVTMLLAGITGHILALIGVGFKQLNVFFSCPLNSYWSDFVDILGMSALTAFGIGTWKKWISCCLFQLVVAGLYLAAHTAAIFSMYYPLVRKVITIGIPISYFKNQIIPPIVAMIYYFIVLLTSLGFALYLYSIRRQTINKFNNQSITTQSEEPNNNQEGLTYV